MTETLISPEALSFLLGRPGVVVLDASWYLPAQKRDPVAEYRTAHIPGAIFFDHDAASDASSPLPHTIPSSLDFAAYIGGLGVTEGDTIVVYDGLGLFSAPRAWWLLKTFGARTVRVLDGGLPAWVAMGLPVESGTVQRPAQRFVTLYDGDAVVGFSEMRDLVETGSLPIADARPAGRFAGEEAEPRAGVRAGHMPGALSLPVSDLVSDGRLKSPDELRAAFEAAGLDPEAPMVTTCGSGVTAAVINLAMDRLEAPRPRLYDGSWTEWGSAADTPVETGPAAKSGSAAATRP
ncbi:MULTISPECIES: 3-mercaptopyruvate sulfurtransferase [unclassified Aureimonas]|uniref:3-mercaptopyruvate sulfurtransferase n=1 Tax=unclassified Aureimonas TaxID=2615206 RepID=UPI0006FC4036|nr:MULTISPECIES: 3-mercaptopyruvate sulfurtransferase [unclassified Aureimonas]KQT60559.1 3-mercaptopyruvate sulfurtransferase [Aureimonas sp. Leaf427]KQT79436.1 3-mercaptopyruvate sulfurtransferase [Aureimonas sp. Leaf460]